MRLAPIAGERSNMAAPTQLDRGRRGGGMMVEAGGFVLGKLTARTNDPTLPWVHLPVRSIRKPSVRAGASTDGGGDVPSNGTFAGPLFAMLLK
jgi:hypothetical protein